MDCISTAMMTNEAAAEGWGRRRRNRLICLVIVAPACVHLGPSVCALTNDACCWRCHIMLQIVADTAEGESERETTHLVQGRRLSHLATFIYGTLFLGKLKNKTARATQVASAYLVV